MAIIVTAGAGDTCCIMGHLHIEARRDKTNKTESMKINPARALMVILLQQQPPGAAMIK